MSELSDILNQLKEMGFAVNPPASQDQLDYLQGGIGVDIDPKQFLPERELSEEILELYRHHNGMRISRSNIQLFDMRLMSAEEAVQFNRVMNGFYRDHDKHLAPILKTVRFLWQDDNSNAMGIYVSGNLKGKIFVLDHEDTDLSPCFSSLVSMYQQWLLCSRFNLHNKDAIDGDEIEPCYAMDTWNTEYPRTKPSEDDEEELKISLSYLEKAKAEENEWTRREYLFAALNLIPFTKTERLIPFLDDSDMFVQTRAVEHLSLRKYAGIEDLFAKVVINGGHNARLSAIGALGETRTDEAEKKLLELLSELDGSGWKESIVRCLHFNYRYEYKQLDDKHYAYRKYPDDEWTEF